MYCIIPSIQLIFASNITEAQCLFFFKNIKTKAKMTFSLNIFGKTVGKFLKWFYRKMDGIGLHK